MFGWDLLKHGVQELVKFFALATSRCTHFVVLTHPICMLHLFKVNSEILFHISATTTVNVGGPVWALGWCPTPLAKTETSQILALYCHTEASQQHKIHTVKQGQTTIQIWDCGKLDSK